MPRGPWSSAKVARRGSLHSDMIGHQVTCPCGFEFVVGSTDEQEHFLFPGGRIPTQAGECIIDLGLRMAIERAMSRQFTNVWFPGEADPVDRVEAERLAKL